MGNIVPHRDQPIDFIKQTNQLIGFCMLVWMTRFLDEGNHHPPTDECLLKKFGQE